MQGISWQGKDVLASQEGLSSKELDITYLLGLYFNMQPVIQWNFM